MKHKSLPKSRDPFIRHIIVKKQGAHGKNKRNTRRAEKQILKKEYLIKIISTK